MVSNIETKIEQKRDRTLDQDLAELDAIERGFVLGALTLAAGDADAMIDRLMAPAADRCRAALAAIAALGRVDRLRVMGVLAERVLAAEPDGLEHVHPARLRALLERESSETIRMVSSEPLSPLRAAATAVLSARGEAADAVVASAALSPVAAEDLRRAVLAPIVAVPSLPPGLVPSRSALRLLAATPELMRSQLQGPDGAVAVAAAGGASDALDARGEVDELAARELRGVRAMGERLGREDPDLARAVADRLPLDLADQLLDAAHRARAQSAPPVAVAAADRATAAITSTSEPS